MLSAGDWETRLSELESLPPRRLLAPLFAALLNPRPLVKWHAVTAFGLTAQRLAEHRLEDARVLMRRLMWSLNEESGNIGWGIPESFGEILACHEGLAREFSRVLCSYIVDRGEEPGNFIEHDPLRRAVYWGLARLAQARPELVRPAGLELRQALNSPDPEVRGLSALALGLCGGQALRKAESRLAELKSDTASFELYWERELGAAQVGALADQALEKLEELSKTGE